MGLGDGISGWPGGRAHSRLNTCKAAETPSPG
jgi:hypothetical protein